MHDPVNSPAHYKKGGIETIEYIEAILGEEAVAYHTGNVLKYVSRWREKGGVEDLKKAVWYLHRMIDREERYEKFKDIVSNQKLNAADFKQPRQKTVPWGLEQYHADAR